MRAALLHAYAAPPTGRAAWPVPETGGSSWSGRRPGSLDLLCASGTSYSGSSRCRLGRPRGGRHDRGVGRMRQDNQIIATMPDEAGRRQILPVAVVSRRHGADHGGRRRRRGRSDDHVEIAAVELALTSRREIQTQRADRHPRRRSTVGQVAGRRRIRAPPLVAVVAVADPPPTTRRPGGRRRRRIPTGARPQRSGRSTGSTRQAVGRCRDRSSLRRARPRPRCSRFVAGGRFVDLRVGRQRPRRVLLGRLRQRHQHPRLHRQRHLRRPRTDALTQVLRLAERHRFGRASVLPLSRLRHCVVVGRHRPAVTSL